MEERVIEDLGALLPPLLGSLEVLGVVARHLDPMGLADVVAGAGSPDAPLREAVRRLEAWPEPLGELKGCLEAASRATLTAFDGLRAAAAGGVDLREALRALRESSRAQEALYPLAAHLQPVSRFFLSPAVRDDAALLARVTIPARAGETGVMHVGSEPGSRGGYSLYVPETYTPGRAWPLVVALHGGSGNGRAFLWSWLRDARSHGAILIAPTAIGPTWALMGEDPDSPNLARMVEHVRGRWNVDPRRLLMTGMSDGGTFCYASGLEPGSPFTHLAPVAAAFHPLLAQMADRDRLHGLPIHIVHGALDWMFPVELARRARQSLGAAGAQIAYRELDDLGHCYPREVNPELLRWLASSE